ncbi:phage/plasmid primase, P4 family [uncultured Phascolarctobacterium sp.]|uniref:phage/plasmid primase, P4 family n=1 Tax=uncultured Phascolarctobacterium sp. TaxID=512296 RepID=UPI0027D97C53|nr:phage/plasmid primase, P4 family [uncultured Phascolarctobacterium sp.]
MFYRGYVRTKNKKCIDKFGKNAKLLAFDEVADLDEYAGIIAADSILIDVDDVEQSKKLLKIVEDNEILCRVLESRNGMHFLFKNSVVDRCYTKVNLACGITADIKSGFKNCYEVLKIEGKERKVIYDIYEDEEYQELPKFLYPIKSKADFINMQAGDGRNQSLFNYILTLQSNGFEVEEARETIRLINDFVLSEPLPADELETVLRDEAFQKPIFFNKNVFLFEKFATFLKNQHHIVRINNQLHLYKDGIYISGQAEIEAEMIKHIPNLNRSKRTEVLSYLDIMIRDNTEVASPDYIAFANGVYNIKTDELKPFNPAYVIVNKIPWNYNPEAADSGVDTVLNNISCNDASIRTLLEEMVGYTMYRRNELGKAFILTGSGKNGKSTFLTMVKRMLGIQNISALDMKKLGDRFSTVMLFNKLANIGDDISDDFLSDPSEFKKICTGELIDAEQKGQPKFQFEPYVKMMFSANSIPRIGKGRDSAAVLRRLVIVPFNATFDKSKADFNSYIIDSLSSASAMEYLIKLGIEGLKNVLANQEFTASDKVQAEIDDFAITNNPVLGFFKENEFEDIENHVTKDVYLRYQKYCYDNGLNAICAGELSKQIKKYYGVTIVDKRVAGKKVRVFKSE